MDQPETSSKITTASTTATSPLTTDDKVRLTRWKWAYCLEGEGFTREEARALVFFIWRYTRPHRKDERTFEDYWSSDDLLRIGMNYRA